MKSTKLIAILVILLMVSGQAMATYCASSCSFAGMNSNAPMMDMEVDNASEKSPSACNHTTGSDSKHNHDFDQCNKAGCHFAQAATFVPDLKSKPLDLAGSWSLSYNSISFSADLAPPIKPPA